MKAPFIFVLAFSLCACGGSLSDEQRAKIKEAEKLQEIRRVTGAEIMNAAYERGRMITKELKSDSMRMDSLAVVNHARIGWIAPGDTSLLKVEAALVDAIIAGLQEGIITDNVQEIGQDSLLYTWPEVATMPDSSLRYKGTWSIMLSKRYLILSMD